MFAFCNRSSYSWKSIHKFHQNSFHCVYWHIPFEKLWLWLKRFHSEWTSYFNVSLEMWTFKIGTLSLPSPVPSSSLPFSFSESKMRNISQIIPSISIDSHHTYHYYMNVTSNTYIITIIIIIIECILNENIVFYFVGWRMANMHLRWQTFEFIERCAHLLLSHGKPPPEHHNNE